MWCSTSRRCRGELHEQLVLICVISLRHTGAALLVGTSLCTMQDISITVAGELASLFCKQQMDALVAQKAIGRGPLMKMNQTELQHWMNELCMAVQAAATSRLRSACEQFSAADESETKMQHFSVCGP